MKPTHEMMVALRGRRGLDEADLTQDQEIKAMDPAHAVRECAAWWLGDPGWASKIAGWIKAAGAKVEDV